MSTEAKTLTIHKVRRTRKAIVISYTHGADEYKGVTFHDNPLPEFPKAFDALGAVVLDILQLPASYNENLKVTGVTVSAISGNPASCIVAQKSLPDANGPFNITTPLRLMDLPTKEGSYSQPLTEAQAGAIEEVIECAKRYVLGERAQGTIKFGDEGDGEEDDGTGQTEPAQGQELQFPAGSTGKPAKKTVAAAAGK